MGIGRRGRGRGLYVFNNNGDRFTPVVGNRSERFNQRDLSSWAGPVSSAPVSSPQPSLAPTMSANALCGIIADLAKQIGDSFATGLFAMHQPSSDP